MAPQRNPDSEPDVLADQRVMLRDLHMKYGDHLRMLIMVSDLTGRPLLEVADSWKRAGQTLQKAISR